MNSHSIQNKKAHLNQFDTRPEHIFLYNAIHFHFANLTWGQFCLLIRQTPRSVFQDGSELAIREKNNKDPDDNSCIPILIIMKTTRWNFII